METEIEQCIYKPKNCQQEPETGRSKEEAEGTNPADTQILDI